MSTTRIQNPDKQHAIPEGHVAAQTATLHPRYNIEAPHYLEVKLHRFGQLKKNTVVLCP